MHPFGREIPLRYGQAIPQGEPNHDRPRHRRTLRSAQRLRPPRTRDLALPELVEGSALACPPPRPVLPQEDQGRDPRRRAGLEGGGHGLRHPRPRTGDGGHRLSSPRVRPAR